MVPCGIRGQHHGTRDTPEKARLTTPVRGGEVVFAVRAALDWSNELISNHEREDGRTTCVATSSQKAPEHEGDAWQWQRRRNEGALHATRVALAAALRDLRRLQEARDGGRERVCALDEAAGAPSLDFGTVAEPDYRHSVILALLGQRRSTRHVITIPHTCGCRSCAPVSLHCLSTNAACTRRQSGFRVRG